MHEATGNTDRALFARILQNDLRLWWRGNATKKAAWASGAVGRLLMLGLAHVVAWGLLQAYHEGVRGGPEFVCLLVLSMLAMGAVNRSLEVLYNRGDLALLLSSPVPPRIVLSTRLVDITVMSLLDSLLIVVPLADMAMILHGGQWAWGFAAWFGCVLTIAPAAVLVTVVAVERFGARRARTAMQLLGVFFGMFAFVASQLPQWLRMSRLRTEQGADAADTSGDVFAWFDVPPLDQLAAAASGSWRWLVPLVAAGALLLAVAQRTLALRFTHGAQGAAADIGGDTARRGATDSSVWQRAFGRSRLRTLVRTQVLLLRRDPLLLMRCAMQVVSLVPMTFGALMFQRAAGIAGVGLLAAAVVPLQLAAIRNANDDAHEFELASPIAPRERAWARAIAAAGPLLVFVWIVAITLAAMNAPLQGVMVAVGGTVNAFAAGWLATCTTRVHTAEERARNRAPNIMWQAFVGMLIGCLGTVGVGMAVTEYWVMGWCVFAAATGIAALQFVATPRLRTTDA